ncbi:hypothetical protein AK812_SmicGene16079 [Symbiodinium microadriaticum]|uniref:Uncharacterized protein n=1 Tax=Symbiodinium microadriaticum TaxID=2951 RepID=A0A1Q9E191_SYMMI|nr:hypothetical protein AK812_SmicGene16079 [Symbiodinium microadriaticum]
MDTVSRRRRGAPVSDELDVEAAAHEPDYQTALSQAGGAGGLPGSGLGGDASPGTLESGGAPGLVTSHQLPVANPFHSDKVKSEVQLLRNRPASLDEDAARLRGDVDVAALGDVSWTGGVDPDYSAFLGPVGEGVPEFRGPVDGTAQVFSGPVGGVAGEQSGSIDESSVRGQMYEGNLGNRARGKAERSPHLQLQEYSREILKGKGESGSDASPSSNAGVPAKAAVKAKAKAKVGLQLLREYEERKAGLPILSKTEAAKDFRVVEEAKGEVAERQLLLKRMSEEEQYSLHAKSTLEKLLYFLAGAYSIPKKYAVEKAESLELAEYEPSECAEMLPLDFPEGVELESVDELFKLPESSGDREVQISAVTHRVRGKRSEADVPQEDAHPEDEVPAVSYRTLFLGYQAQWEPRTVEGDRRCRQVITWGGAFEDLFGEMVEAKGGICLRTIGLAEARRELSCWKNPAQEEVSSLEGREYCLVQTKTDDALWLLRELDTNGMGKIEGVLVVYVDDLAVFAPEGLAKEFILAIQTRMSQCAYIRELLNRYGIEENATAPLLSGLSHVGGKLWGLALLATIPQVTGQPLQDRFEEDYGLSSSEEGFQVRLLQKFSLAEVRAVPIRRFNKQFMVLKQESGRIGRELLWE